ncbi:MAG: hypothetical protein GX921_01120 [Bacteroidales bacterium]|nr:hypothetical protein [Bacteroidales bacterium]
MWTLIILLLPIIGLSITHIWITFLQNRNRGRRESIGINRFV